jgi:hypothetical protein
VTRSLSKAHSLAGFRVGYAVLPRASADDLNSHNDAYPLTETGQAAAIASLRNEAKISGHVDPVRQWARDLAVQSNGMGVRTFRWHTVKRAGQCVSESRVLPANLVTADAETGLSALLRTRRFLQLNHEGHSRTNSPAGKFCLELR